MSDTADEKLWRVADAGDVDAVRRELAVGDANVDAYDDAFGATALMRAAAGGHVDVVDSLLAAPCDLEDMCYDGWTALGYAVFEDHAAVVERLIAAGTSTDTVDSSDSPALLCAVKCHSHDSLDVLLASGRVDVTARNEDGESALSVACSQNLHATDVVDRLLDRILALATRARGFRQELIAQDLSRALERAIESGNIEIIQKLINASAHVKPATDYTPPLVLVARHDRVEILRMLLDAGADVNAVTQNGGTALAVAASRGSTSIVEMLLQVPGLTIDHANEDGNTALMFAIEKGHVDTVDLLIAAGADVHHVNKVGETTLIRASRTEKIEVVELLLDKDVDAGAVTQHGQTALFGASTSGCVGIVELLLATGKLDVNHVDRHGDSALLLAVHHNCITVVDVLLAHGAHVNYSGRVGHGMTALILAAKHGYDPLVRSLIHVHSADVHPIDRAGSTAFLRAARSTHLEIMKMLHVFAIDVNATDNAGRSALDYATWARSIKALEWLQSHTAVDMKDHTNAAMCD